MTDFYDREGKPLELLDWARKYEDGEYRQVALTRVAGGAISTIWIGFNQGLSLQPGPHHLYETALLGKEDAVEILGRWDTEAEAQEGHGFAVAARGGPVA